MRSEGSSQPHKAVIEQTGLACTQKLLQRRGMLGECLKVYESSSRAHKAVAEKTGLAYRQELLRDGMLAGFPSLRRLESLSQRSPGLPHGHV